MKKIILAVFIMTLTVAGFAQSNQRTSLEYPSGDTIISYAYVLIRGKLFSKRLSVEVDLGDSPGQLKEGKAYSDSLSNKRSFAAVLNYMAERKFELVETLEYTESAMGSGGTTGVVFIMRRK